MRFNAQINLFITYARPITIYFTTVLYMFICIIIIIIIIIVIVIVIIIVTLSINNC